MSLKLVRAVLVLLFLSLVIKGSRAQGLDKSASGIKVNLNQDGSKYIRFTMWNQIWVRSIKNNPGTLVAGESSEKTFDIGARRIRTIIYAQLSPRYLIFTHFGVNNQTFLSNGASGTAGTGANGAGKKPQIFYHDVWNEYAIVPTVNSKTGKENKFTSYVGAGLHYWNGLSRQNATSTTNLLMIDAPSFNWPTLEMSDQLTRQYGLYTKGKFGKLHYQACVNKPFVTNVSPVAGGAAVDNNGNPKMALGAYCDYQFLDQEASTTPFRVGTYLGAKKVFNIGAGFFSNQDGTKSLTLDNELKKHDIGIYAIDAFADIPIGNKSRNMAVTAYSALYKYNYGPNYIRANGVMNPGTVDASFEGKKAQEGAGNARYVLGSGNIWYAQAGVLLPKQISKKIRFQPMAAYAIKDLDALSESGSYYDVGTNFFIDGHNSKITVQYSNRPLYNENRVFKHAGEWLMQFQVYL